MTILLVTFYALAAISIYLGVLSLRNRMIHSLPASRLAKEYSEYEPFVTVFLPLRGADHELEKNIMALFAQTYANYEVIFVSDDAKTIPPWGIVEEELDNRLPANQDRQCNSHCQDTLMIADKRFTT